MVTYVVPGRLGLGYVMGLKEEPWGEDTMAFDYVIGYPVQYPLMEGS